MGSDAEDQCRLMMGHLVSYTSRDELNTVWSNFNNYSETFWIGLRQNVNGGWAWTDGRPGDFTWWNTGEPNNKGDENEGAVRYTTPAPGPTTKYTNGAAVVIGILIAIVVLILGVIGGIIYCKKQGNSTAHKITD